MKKTDSTVIAHTWLSQLYAVILTFNDIPFINFMNDKNESLTNDTKKISKKLSFSNFGRREFWT